MIYAKLDNRSAHPDIARAIAARDSETIEQFVQKGDIIHIMDAAEDGPFFCIYCQDEVFPTTAKPPRGRHAKSPWHFQHRTNPGCIGHANPARHGCYVALGCETVKDRNRANCQTIDQIRRATYCHLAKMSPPCVR